MAFVESVCTGKAPVGPKPGEIKEPGIEEMTPVPIQTQAPATPKPPLARDVNVRDVRRQDEGYLLPPAEGSVKKEVKVAALESRPTIKLLAQRIAALQQAELERYRKKFGPVDREMLAEFARTLCNKIMHDPISFLHELGGRGDDGETMSAVDVLRRIFDLDSGEDGK